MNVQETNKKASNIMTNELKDFRVTFQINRTTIFEVAYYHCGNNKDAYFSTSAAVFNRPKTDFNRCGQCQKDVLTGDALSFYKKWDVKHLSKLTQSEYETLLNDLKELKTKYNCVNHKHPDDRHFSSQKELSKIKKLSSGIEYNDFN